MPALREMLVFGKGAVHGAIDGSRLIEKDESPRHGGRHPGHRSKHRQHTRSGRHPQERGHRSKSRKVIYDPSDSSSASGSSRDSSDSEEAAKPSTIREVIVHSGRNRLKDRAKMFGWTLAGYWASRLAQGGKRGGKSDHGTIAELRKRHKPTDEIEGFGAAVIGATAVHAIKQIGSRLLEDGGKVDRKKHKRDLRRKHISRAGKHR